MKIKLHQVSDRAAVFEFKLSRSDTTKLDDRIRFDAISCRAELTRKQDVIALHGTYTVSIETICDNCLDPVALDLGREFDLILVSEEDYEEPEGDVELSLRSDDVDYFDGQEIPLSNYFEDQLLLDLPFSIRCSDNCRGICPKCGVNRNHEDCLCSGRAGNNPFSVLKDLKS